MEESILNKCHCLLCSTELFKLVFFSEFCFSSNIFFFGSLPVLSGGHFENSVCLWLSDEFEDVLQHTELNDRIPFDFDSHFIRMHFGKDRQRNISYAEFTQLLHVCWCTYHFLYQKQVGFTICMIWCRKLNLSLTVLRS